MTESESFWNTRWVSAETGWDMKQVSPPLKYFIDNISDKDLKILIPGCGNAYEASYLVDNGFENVTLIDISSHLVSSLRRRLAGKPIKIIHGNYFEHLGKYDLILEQTFFCAINPKQRGDYVKQAFELLNKNGRIAGVLFNEHFGFVDHPPYLGNEKEYLQLFKPYFDILRMEPCTISIQPRLGNELLVEFQKKVRIESQLFN